MKNIDKTICSVCNKSKETTRNYYKILLNNQIKICRYCFCKDYENIRDKHHSDEMALLIMCEKYNFYYDLQLFNKIKLKTNRDPFKIYITYISTLMGTSILNNYTDKLKEYISKNNILIDNIFTYNYKNIIDSLGIEDEMEKYKVCTLELIVRYYNFKYPGYLFNIKPIQYYNKKENLIFDLRYFIEKDMHIPIERIPEELSLKYLEINNPKLHFISLTNNEFSNLFEWINACYPNRFKKAQFPVNKIIYFDSFEEQKIDKELRKDFKNVIYNNRSYTKIKLNHMMPDWFIFTENGVIVVEYFGLWTDNYSSTVNKSLFLNYRESTHNKINNYSKLNGYKFLYIFPRDIKDNAKGLHEKINDLMKQES